MEGGQKQNISLESELDIKTSDMMSNISQPKFAHNRQQYQGHYLPSSLRFEHDGWAAGWDVYNFKFSETCIPTSPEGYFMTYIKISHDTYKLSVCNKIDNTYIELGYILYCSNSKVPDGIELDIHDNTVYLLGNFNGKDFNIWFPVNDIEDSHMITSGNLQYDITQKYNTSTFDIDVVDIDTMIDDAIILKPVSDLKMGSTELKFVSMHDDTYTWEADGIRIEYNKNTNKCIATYNNYTDSVSYDVIDNKLNGYFTKAYNYIANMKLSITDNISTYNILKQKDNLSITSNKNKSNKVDKIDITFNNRKLTKDTPLHVAMNLPVWKGFSVSHDNLVVVTVEDVKGAISLSATNAANGKKYIASVEYIGKKYTVKIYPALWLNNSIYKSNFYDEGIEIPDTYKQKITINARSSDASGGYFPQIISDYIEGIHIEDVHTISAIADGSSVNGNLPDAFISIRNNNDTILDYMSYFDADSVPDYLKNMTIKYKVDNNGKLHFSGKYQVDDHGYAELIKAPLMFDLFIDDNYYIKNSKPILHIEDSTFDNYIDVTCNAINTDVSKKTSSLSIILQLKNDFKLFCTVAESDKRAKIPNNIYLGAVTQDMIGDDTKDESGMCLAMSPIMYQQEVSIDTIYLCNNAIVTWNKPTIYPHKFITEALLPAIDNFKVTINATDGNIQDIRFMWCDNEQHLTFSNKTGMLTYNTPIQSSLDDVSILQNIAPVKDNNGNSKTDFQISYSFSLQYDISTHLPSAIGYTIASINNNRYDLKHIGSNKDMWLDTTNMFFCIGNKRYAVSLSSNGEYYTPYRYYEDYTFSVTAAIPFKTYNIDMLSFDNDTVSFALDDNVYSFKCTEVLGINNSVEFKYTNTKDSELKENTICKIDCNSGYTFLKQKWDTTSAIENYWWIDSKHILSLTKTHLILHENTDVLDDWNGNKFTDIKSWSRDSILQYLPNGDLNSCIKYGCTCAYNGDTSLFYNVHQFDEYIAIVFFNPLTEELNQINLRYNHVDIGKPLNENNSVLNSYSDLQLISIISDSKYSATCINGFILFGIHYDNNYNQWTVKINRNTFIVDKIVQGYGYVGVDGSLTGGEIPFELFGSNGFNDTVKPLSTLKSDIVECYNNINQVLQIDCGESVVGTDSQQWYIYKHISGIVSHLSWNSKILDWDIIKLPLNNNLDQIYKSASFASRLLSNYMPYVNSLESIFPKAMLDSGSPIAATIKVIINTAFALAGAPLIYIIMPYLSLFNELQQTFGQYAYVHYNSTNIHKSKDITKGNDDYVNNDKDDLRAAESITPQDSDSVIFNVHTVPQTAEHLNPFIDLITTIMQFGFDTSDVDKVVKINEHTDITPNKETNNSVSTPYYIYNKDNLCAAEMSTRGFTPTTTTKVTGCLSLDMFYSTCDQQKISAGPGWVNHNFVAQCTAQSITTHSMYMQQVAMKFVLGFLTEQQLDLIYNAEKAGYDFLEDTRNTYADFQAMASSIGVIPATAAMAAKAVLRVSMLMIEGCKRYMKDSILPALGDGKIEFIRPAKKETTTYDCERTHKYGSKTECFMWPCFDIPQNMMITDESVVADITDKPWKLNVPLSNNIVTDNLFLPITVGNPRVNGIVTDVPEKSLKNGWNGNCSYFIANARGEHTKVYLPNDMAYVAGVESFMPPVQYRNENVGESEPVFATPPFQDYVIDKNWQLGQTSSVSMTTWVSCGDTKIIDGEYSNIVIDGLSFCGVACPYTAIEVKTGISKRYLRPWAITPNALALNITGINCCYDEKAYHAFDGYGYRIVNWTGVPGMNKEHQTFMYNFLVNDRFKRSNKLPLNEFLGNFKSDPVTAIKGDTNDKPFKLVTQPGENVGITAGTIGEDKDARRYAIPVFSEFVSTLPAVVKTVAANSLSVIDGITSLTTANRDLQTAYKAPLSIDFAIGKNLYRFTNEYICSLSGQKGVTTTQDVVPCLGLEFIGATPYAAYLYSPATKQYYSYSGGSSLDAVDMIERFRDVINGRYDFVNQEVLMPCLATFNRLDSNVHDDEDETDNVLVPRIKNNKFIGEIWPPINTIFNTQSWFRTLSMPMGIVYQGPNRCIINRFVYSDYMLQQIKDNYGLWQRVPKEKYNPFRKYKAVYKSVDKQIGDSVLVKGWTHNPFLLVTAPLGIGEETDCIFEWEITFCWPVEMDKLYGPKDFAVVNIQAETMTPGGKVVAARPTHVYLSKDLFTRTGNYGYYSFRYQSECGIGNRERLHIWSDQYICISGLQVDCKTMTNKRSEILTQHIDIQQMNEI